MGIARGFNKIASNGAETGLNIIDNITNLIVPKKIKKGAIASLEATKEMRNLTKGISTSSGNIPSISASQFASKKAKSLSQDAFVEGDELKKMQKLLSSRYELGINNPNLGRSKFSSTGIETALTGEDSKGFAKYLNKLNNTAESMGLDNSIDHDFVRDAISKSKSKTDSLPYMMENSERLSQEVNKLNELYNYSYFDGVNDFVDHDLNSENFKKVRQLSNKQGSLFDGVKNTYIDDKGVRWGTIGLHAAALNAGADGVNLVTKNRTLQRDEEGREDIPFIPFV
jgi:hypothetical protein